MSGAGTAAWDRCFVDFRLLTMDPEQGAPGDRWGRLEPGAVGVREGRIVWVGRLSDLPSLGSNTETVEGRGAFLTPGLIDCHTHLAYAGDRAEEWERRLAGESYEAIARAGGGILSTLNATRRATEAELIDLTAGRAARLLGEGVTRIEIKSGYGLDVDTELKLLRVAREVGKRLPISVAPTLLAAHAVPPEFSGRPDDYLELVIEEILPAVVRGGLATACDVFIEGIAFDVAQAERLFRAAREQGLALKSHSEQLSLLGGAALTARMGGLSADHLEYLDGAGIAAMAKAGTVATLLPGAFYFLREKQPPPVSALRAAGVPLAIATDWNPGSSPAHSLLLMGNMACTLWGMQPVEVIEGMTVHAARAIGLPGAVGQLKVGQVADLAIWDISSPAGLVAGMGHNPCIGVVRNGEVVAG